MLILEASEQQQHLENAELNKIRPDWTSSNWSIIGPARKHTRLENTELDLIELVKYWA